jgi:polysaccharide biosynthesis protein PslH
MPELLKPTFHGILGVSKFRYLNPLLFFKLKKLIKEKGITNLIIVHPYFGWLAWLLKKSTGIQLAVLSHNIESIRFKSMRKFWWRLLWVYEKNVHKIMDHNFFVTEEDRIFAIEKYKLNADKCHVITYGIEWNQLPTQQEKKEAATQLRKLYEIMPEEQILFFNGSLDYLPNIEAVTYIIEHINPILLQEKKIKYKIIICGKGLPPSFDNLKAYKDKNIIYAGFVEDIHIVFKGADIFINPVINGGGIKTKLVEALGNSLTAVSSQSGAFGIPIATVTNKLTIVNDYDWNLFAKAILDANVNAETDSSFLDHFYWGNIAEKAKRIII